MHLEMKASIDHDDSMLPPPQNVEKEKSEPPIVTAKKCSTINPLEPIEEDDEGDYAEPPPIPDKPL